MYVHRAEIYDKEYFSHLFFVLWGTSDKTQLKALKGFVYFTWNKAVVLLFMFNKTLI